MKPLRQSITKKRQDYGGEDNSDKVSTMKAHGNEASARDNEATKYPQVGHLALRSKASAKGGI